MASAVEDTVADDDLPSSQADYLPEFFGAPVAAGPEIDPLTPASDRLAGGRFRRLVPTPRQREAGAEFPELQDVPKAVGEEEAAPRTRWRLRARGYAASINPLSIPGPKLPLAVFALSYLITGWDDAAVRLIAPELRADLGVSVQTLVTFVSVSTAVGIALAIPFGYLADRVKRVQLIRIEAIGANLSSLLQALATSQGLYFGARMVGRVSDSIGGPARVPLMSDYYPSRARARVNSLLFAVAHVGRIIGLPVAGYFIVAYGWRQAVFALSLVALVTACTTFLLKEPVRGGMDRLELGMTREAAAVEPEPPTWQEAARTAWSVRTLRRQVYSGVVAQLAGPLTTIVALVQAERFFLDAGQRATIATLQSLVVIPLVLLGGVLADRLLVARPAGLAAIQGGAYLVGALALVGEALAPNVYVFVAFSLVSYGALSAMLPATVSIVALVVPAQARGVGLQLFAPFHIVGLLLGPVVALAASGLPLQQALMAFAPVYAITGFILLSTAATIERDIRAARAAGAAGTEARRAAEAGHDKILVCRDVDVAYDGVQILFNVDLDVARGECLALLGTNGAGKSTLLRAIAGVQEAENGAIFFEGKDITHVPAHENARNGIVMMPGGAAVFPSMTVRENLATAGWAAGRDQAALDEAIEEVLGFFPILRDRFDIEAGSMSGGEQQMLALGQAFLMRPRLLMIDELSLGLAPAVIEELLGILRQIRTDGTTVILVEQSLNVALTVAERAVFMEKGEIHFDGPTDALLQRPDLVRSIFMGGATGGSAPRVRRRTAAADGPQEAALEVEGATVAFGGVQALRDVGFSVAAGEIVGVIGPNGAGKTTLFDVVSGYVRPDRGRVLLEGTDVTDLPPDARARLGLGRAFQSARLFPPLTVRENIALALERRTVKSPVLAALWAPPVRDSERRIATRVDGYIEILGLEAYADKFVGELSTGTRRAVEVACQMAAEPKVLLLDEPSSGLAQAETEALGPALTRVVRETGCGLLVIEHDLPLITSLSDRLVAMELGQVVVVGTPQEVTSDPRVLQSYLAASNDVIERSGSRVGTVLSLMTASQKGTTEDGRSG